MLRRKYVVQKSIRIDAKLSEDLEILSKTLDRPQSELIGLALEQMMRDNASYFALHIFADSFSAFLQGDVEKDECEITQNGITYRIILETGDDYENILKWSMENESGIVQSHEKKYPNTLDALDHITEHLIQLAFNLDRQHETVQEYLKHRLDYR